ncbi:MAG: hypothetical protein Q7S95_01370 [bacterium]|nr:hypothetical protein [bacterium]
MRHFANAQHLRHHAFAIEAEGEQGIEVALGWVARELGMSAKGNPDIVILKYGLFSVEDARRVIEVAAQGPLAGEMKAIIIAASRAYREAQNALLKLFEEPPPGTYLFLILPSLGGLLPTLRSRIQVLAVRGGHGVSANGGGHAVSSTGLQIAEEFLKASREKRSAIAKKLANGKDEEDRREYRDEALAIVNGIETAAYAQPVNVRRTTFYISLLEEIQVLRGYLHQPSASVRMILEHLAIVTPRPGSGQAPRDLGSKK